MASERYSQQLDALDAAVFSGEMLQTNFEEFKTYVTRWQREVARHEQALAADRAIDSQSAEYIRDKIEKLSDPKMIEKLRDGEWNNDPNKT